MGSTWPNGGNASFLENWQDQLNGLQTRNIGGGDTTMRAKGKPEDGMAPPEVGNATGRIYITLD